MGGAQRGGKGKGTGIAGSKVKGASSASSNSTTDMRPAAAAQTDTIVPPPPPGSPLRAAASLASMSLTAPTTPVLTSETAEEVQDLTGSDKGVVTDAEINAGAHTEDMTRKLKDSERKRKERAEAAAAKGAQAECSSSTSMLMQTRVSPRKLAAQKALIRGAPSGTVNWSSSDDVRMIFVACCPEIQKLFELLGHPSNRGELEGSNSATDARPSSAFYAKLAEIFSDSAFKGAVPADWPRDEHLPVTKLYALREARDGAWMKNKWRSLGARHEVAWRRYCGVSGTDGYSCFCGCGKGGFWTTSGFLPHHANKLSSDETVDAHGDRKCVAPLPHLGVYVWSVAMANNACMREKGSIVIPAGVRSEGEVGTARGQLARSKAGRSVKRGAASDKVGSSDEDDSEHENRKKQEQKVKQVVHNHSQATFLDDGQASSRSTRASRESSMIAALAKLAPQEATPLDALFKRRAQLLEEDQTLMTNLYLAQKVLAETPAGDTEGVVWAKDKIARIRATSTKADAARDANDAAILEAQEKEAERQRQQGCRKQLLSSLQRVGSTGSNSEAEEMRDEDDE